MILYNKKATLYKYSKNESGVSSYNQTGTLFACAIQPVGEKDGFEGVDILKTKKMYCDKKIEVGDKVVIDGITYIVNSTQLWDGSRRQYYKSFINESNGD